MSIRAGWKVDKNIFHFPPKIDSFKKIRSPSKKFISIQTFFDSKITLIYIVVKIIWIWQLNTRYVDIDLHSVVFSIDSKSILKLQHEIINSKTFNKNIFTLICLPLFNSIGQSRFIFRCLIWFYASNQNECSM